MHVIIRGECREIYDMLRRAGFEFERCGGRHLILRHPCGRIFTLPNRLGGGHSSRNIWSRARQAMREVGYAASH